MSWVVSIQTSHLNLGDYGLITSLNVAYWLSLGLLMASFAVLLAFRSDIRWLLAAQVVFLIVALYLTPFLIEGTPRLTTGFTHYADADYVVNHGRLDASAVTYHNWPGYSLVVSQLVIITHLNSPLLVMGLFPFVVKLASLLPLYLLFRRLTHNDGLVIAAGLWIYSLAFWVNQDYASPQAIALFLMLLVSWMFSRLDKDYQAGSKTPYVAAVTLVFFTIVLTHTLTSIAVLAIAVILVLFRRLPGIQIALLFAMIFLAWSVYGAATEFRFYLPIYWEKSFRLDEIFQMNLGEGFGGTLTRKLISWSRIALSAVVGGLALYGAAMTFFRKRWQGRDTVNLGLALGAFCLLPVWYGFELFHRIFVYSLAPLSNFAGKLGAFGKAATASFVVILVVLLPFHILTRYGSEVAAHTGTSELALQSFYFDYTTSGHVIGGGNYLTFRRPEMYSQTIYLEDRWDTSTISITWPAMASPRERYFCITYYDRISYSRFSTIPDIIGKMTTFADSSPHYNLVYSDPGAILYNYSD